MVENGDKFLLGRQTLRGKSGQFRLEGSDGGLNGANPPVTLLLLSQNDAIILAQARKVA